MGRLRWLLSRNNRWKRHMSAWVVLGRGCGGIDIPVSCRYRYSVWSSRRYYEGQRVSDLAWGGIGWYRSNRFSRFGMHGSAWVSVVFHEHEKSRDADRTRDDQLSASRSYAPGGIKLWRVPNDILPTMTDPLMAAMDVTYHLLLNLHRPTPHNFDTPHPHGSARHGPKRGLIDPRCRL